MEPVNFPNNFSSSQKTKEYIKAFKRAGIIFIILIGILFIFSISTYTVGEAEQAVVSQFGVVKEIIISPENTYVNVNKDLMSDKSSELKNVIITKAKGLRFKIPFITTIIKYDSRYLTYVSSSESVNTLEKKQYLITMYSQWRIANPGLFSITQREIPIAMTYLDGLIYPSVIQNINRLSADDFLSNKEVLNKALADGLKEINKKVRDSGIEIADIQVHRTILPNANLKSTYDRMIANRAKVAQQLRSEGEEAYQKSISAVDKEFRVIEAEAIKQSEKNKGDGDASALEIYANSYSKDPEFYTYWRSLIALQKAIDENTVLVLDNNNPLWKDVLKWINPELPQ
jgi:modulator of FtsH protease HflC